MEFFNTFRHNIHQLLDGNAKTISAKAIRSFILFLIMIVAVIIALEFFSPSIYQKYEYSIILIDKIILYIFAVEVLLRIICYPKILNFFKKPLNLTDLIAVVPSIIGFVDVSYLRIFRVLRLVKLFTSLKYATLLKFKNSIFEKIFAVVVLFIALKIFVWNLEINGVMEGLKIQNNLISIIGFSLGIVLSLKLGSTYTKFKRITEIILRIKGRLLFFQLIIDKYGKEYSLNSNAVKNWATSFLELFKESSQNSNKFNEANMHLLDIANNFTPARGELFSKQSDLAEDSTFILGEGRDRTPQVYNDLLHQALVLYLLLLTVSISGITGMIAVFLATHLLYGIYYMTLDFDSIIGGTFDLFNVDLRPIQDISEDKT